METVTSAQRLLFLIAISGECSTEVIPLLDISPSYSDKLITKLKNDKLIKTHYKDRLRGYRLTSKGKKLLLESNPLRFSFYLNGNTDTNRPRSDLPRRLRLQQASIVYSMLLGSMISFFRDQKPLLFHNGNHTRHTLLFPSFYHSRELKELGIETAKINNSRMMGTLLSSHCVYIVYNTGDALLKWGYQTELKVKNMINYHISQGILKDGYPPNAPVKALFIGKDMVTALKLLTSTGGFQKSYFHLDSSFEYFHYVPTSPEGQTLLKILCSHAIQKTLSELLLSDQLPPNPDYAMEHDAVWNNRPVLLAYDFDMLRISRFHTALSFHGFQGHLICFDFQKEVLQQYFKDAVSIETIDLKKFERMMLTEIT